MLNRCEFKVEREEIAVVKHAVGTFVEAISREKQSLEIFK